MLTFKYLAKDNQGRRQKGCIQAKNKEDFFRMLTQKGLYCIAYTQNTFQKAVKGKLNFKQLAIFSRQLETMLASGMPLVKALAILEQQTEDTKLKIILRHLHQSIQRGNALSKSLKGQGKAFPQLLIAMVASGEESGTLDKVLGRMALHYEMENKLKNKVTQAMIYPTLVLSACIGVMLLLILVVVPSFAELFMHYGELPQRTQMILHVSEFLKNHGIEAVLVMMSISVVMYTMSLTTRFKYRLDQLKLVCPKVGDLNKIILSARFAETVSTLYATGMSLVRVLEVTQKVLDNTYLDRFMDEVKDEMLKGIPLSDALRAINLFPPMLSSMILIGEESGQLEEILDKTARFYEEESEAALQKMLSLIGPLMIVVVGLMVAGVIGAILPPLYELMGNI